MGLKTAMNKSFRQALFLTCLLLPFTVAAQDTDVKASVAISVQQDQVIWAGQQVTLNLDLKTSGFSFSNSHFNLPEVSGAFLLQTDTTTIKFTENIDGESWQIIRYPLALYPQKAGLLEVPSINVRFSTSAGFGSTEKDFEFQTEPMKLTIKLPPGVKDGDLVVTTTDFELDYDWQPASATVHTGDALTLRVRRRAKDISAMLLPPLPVFRTDGLATYPQAPDISDKTNRGDLTGERTDSIIWVVEKPGVYDIPGIRFQWWDPHSQALKQQIIAGKNLAILPSPAGKNTVDSSDLQVQPRNYFLWLLTIVSIAIAAILLWLRFGNKQQEQAVDTEKTAFKTLQQACQNNRPAQTYAAMYVWLAWQPGSPSLSEFRHACNDTQLSTELKLLQEALVSSRSNWQGHTLRTALRRIRRKLHQQNIVQSKAHLAPLNP